MPAAYDTIANVYEIICDSFGALSQTDDDVAFIMQHIPSGNILDIGCGTGRHLISLAQHGYDMTGVDISAAMLAILRKKLQFLGLHAHVICKDVNDIKYFRKKFSGIICMWNAFAEMALTHEEAIALCAKLHHSLATGGKLIIHVSNRLNTLGFESHKTRQLDNMRYNIDFSPHERLVHARITSSTLCVTAGQQWQTTIIQKWWRARDLIPILKAAGFHTIQTSWLSGFIIAYL